MESWANWGMAKEGALSLLTSPHLLLAEEERESSWIAHNLKLMGHIHCGQDHCMNGECCECHVLLFHPLSQSMLLAD